MTAAPIRILSVDDHAVFREGIASLVQPQEDMTIVGEAANGVEALEAYRRLRPDVTLLDIQMPVMGGLEAIAAMRAIDANARIVVLTTYQGDVQALRALKAGACGYLLKSSLRHELLEIIRTVHAGRRFVLPEVAQEIALHAVEEPLTAREIEVLGCIAAGGANKSIAWRLGLSEDTVKAHVRSILSKLGVSDRTQAVTTALRRGIIVL
ncbi:MAG: response regulator transcription factor [Brevundimonas sp.]|nr:response regulator transcription factor [Brevundimonas sp.]